MTKKNRRQEDDTNYSFLLKCMAGITAAAIVTAGVIAAVTLKSAAAATTAIAAKTLLASTLIFTPVFPIALIVIGLVFVLPFLFGCNNNTYTTVRTTTTPGYSGYGNYSFYSPDYHEHDDTNSTVYTSNDHTHGNPTTPGNIHGHDGSHIHEHRVNNTHGHF